MADVVVTFDGQRVNAADTNTDWGNEPTGGPAPSAEPQLRYQGQNAVNKKITDTGSLAGIKYDPGSGAIDMTQAANRLWFAKIMIADFGDINAVWGVALRIGQSNSDYADYNIAGSGANRGVFLAYPARGGYIIVAIDPQVIAWHETTSPAGYTAIDYFVVQAQFVVGGAKAENVAMDAIDIGTGLTLVGGDGGFTDGIFQDFIDEDEGDAANRWGCVSSADGAIIARGILTIGSAATATEFVDSVATVIFPDGYHSAGLFGIVCDIQNVNTIIDIGAVTIVGNGDITTEDTRPDFIVVGTSGSFDFGGTLLNHRNVTFTSICDVSGATIEAQLLIQDSANISDCIIRTKALTSIACLQDSTFGLTTDLHDCEFIQAGVGHAIELDTATTYTFTGLTFTGYGADHSDDAALDVTASSGTVTVNWSGGTEPTYKSAGATVIIQNSVDLTVKCIDEAGDPIENAQCAIYKTSDDSELMNEDTLATGFATQSVPYSAPTDIYYRIRKSSEGATKYFPTKGTGQYNGNGFSVIVTLYENPYV